MKNLDNNKKNFDCILEKLYKKYITDDGIFRKDTPDIIEACLMVYTVEGIIGNGGFEYLFEYKFPDKNIEDIANAYKLIGAATHAQMLEFVTSLAKGKDFKKIQNNDKLREAENYFFENSKNIDKLIYERLSKKYNCN